MEIGNGSLVGQFKVVRTHILWASLVCHEQLKPLPRILCRGYSLPGGRWYVIQCEIFAMICYCRLHYPDTEPTSHCPILIMPCTWLGSDKYQFYKSLVWLRHGFKPTVFSTRDPYSTDLSTVPGCWFWSVGFFSSSENLFQYFCRNQRYMPSFTPDSMYSKTSLTDHLHYIDHFISVPNNRPYRCLNSLNRLPP